MGPNKELHRSKFHIVLQTGTKKDNYKINYTIY